MSHFVLPRGVERDCPFFLLNVAGGNLIDSAQWTTGLTSAQWPTAKLYTAPNGAGTEVTSSVAKDITADVITAATHKHPTGSTGLWRKANGIYRLRAKAAVGLAYGDYYLRITFEPSTGTSYAEDHLVSVVPAGDVSFEEGGYADLAVVRQRSGVTYTDLGLATDDDLEALLISFNGRASSAIDAYCKRDFRLHENALEKYDGTDDRSLDLRGWPIVALTSVKDNGATLVSGTDYRQKPSIAGGDSVGILEKPPGEVWASEWDRYEVTYTYGYATPPLEVRRIAEDQVTRMLQAAKADREAAGASSVSMDGFSTTYDRATLTGELQGDDQAALAKWRFMRLG